MSTALASKPSLFTVPATPPRLSVQHLRSLARLCRWIMADQPRASATLGQRAVPAAQALREAAAAWRRRRLAPQAQPLVAPPEAALATLAAAGQQWAPFVQARPNGFFAPAQTGLGHELLLNMPQFKAWLRQGFVSQAAPPTGMPDAAAVQHIRDVLLQRCLAEFASEDSFHRRRHLVQMLAEHGHGQPLLALARQAAQAWAPTGWAESWEEVAGLPSQTRLIASLDRAFAALTPALQAWAKEPSPHTNSQPTPPTPKPAPPAAPLAAPEAAGAAPAAAQAWQRLARLPARRLWWAGGAALLAIGLGLALHLNRGSGPAAAKWVVFHVSDGATLSIDPASIQRSGHGLTYNVAAVRTKDGRSSIAVYSTDCRTRQRRLETVQHYRGTRFDTPTLYEVRGTASSNWPSFGPDVELLRAACAKP